MAAQGEKTSAHCNMFASLSCRSECLRSFVLNLRVFSAAAAPTADRAPAGTVQEQLAVDLKTALVSMHTNHKSALDAAAAAAATAAAAALDTALESMTTGATAAIQQAEERAAAEAALALQNKLAGAASAQSKAEAASAKAAADGAAAKEAMQVRP